MKYYYRCITVLPTFSRCYHFLRSSTGAAVTVLDLLWRHRYMHAVHGAKRLLCRKDWLGFSTRSDSISGILMQPSLPSFDTIIHKSHIFSRLIVPCQEILLLCISNFSQASSSCIACRAYVLCLWLQYRTSYSWILNTVWVRVCVVRSIVFFYEHFAWIKLHD